MEVFKITIDDKEYNLLFSMLFWKYLAKETDYSMDKIDAALSSTDLIDQMEVIAAVLYAGAVTYDNKHNVDQGLDPDTAFEMLSVVDQEEVAKMFNALTETKVFGRRLKDFTAAPEEAGK